MGYLHNIKIHVEDEGSRNDFYYCDLSGSTRLVDIFRLAL